MSVVSENPENPFDSSQRHFQPRLGRATVVASYFDHLQAPTRCAAISGSSVDAHFEIYGLIKIALLSENPLGNERGSDASSNSLAHFVKAAQLHLEINAPMLRSFRSNNIFICH